MILFINIFRTLSTSITTDNLGQSSVLPSSPPHTSLLNSFEPGEQPSQSMSMSANHQENIPPIPAHPRSMTISTESMIIRNFVS